MVPLGKRLPGSTIYVDFNANDSAGAKATITGLAVTGIEIYRDGSTTQRSSDSGYTLQDTDGIDLDDTQGVNGFSVDLSDDTDTGYYRAGSYYRMDVNGVSVDGQPVAFSYSFEIGYLGAFLETTIATLASQTSFTLTAGPSDDDALNSVASSHDVFALIHDKASAVQIAIGKVSDYAGSTKTVTLASDPSVFTMAAGDNISFFLGAAA